MNKKHLVLALALALVSLASVVSYEWIRQGDIQVTNNPSPTPWVKYYPAMANFEPVLAECYIEDKVTSARVVSNTDFDSLQSSTGSDSNGQYTKWKYGFSKNLPTGYYNFHSKAENDFTNSFVYDMEIIVDVTPPKVENLQFYANGQLSGNVVNEGTNVTLKFKVTDDDLALLTIGDPTGVIAVNVTLLTVGTGGEVENETVYEGSDIYSINYTDLAIGNYVIKIYAYDNLSNTTGRTGNVNDSVNYSFSIADTTIPGINLVQPRTGYTSTRQPDIIIRTSEAAECNISTFAGSAIGNFYYDANKLIHNYSYSNTGQFLNTVDEFNVSCMDVNGNVNSTKLTLTVLLTTPNIDSLTSTRGLIITSEDANGKFTSLSVDIDELSVCKFNVSTKAMAPDPSQLVYENMTEFDNFDSYGATNLQDVTQPIRDRGANGEFTFYVICENLAGTPSSAKSVNVTVSIDGLFEIAKGPSGVLTDNTPTLSVETVPESECEYNTTGGWDDFVGGEILQHTEELSELEEGYHSYTLRCYIPVNLFSNYDNVDADRKFNNTVNFTIDSKLYPLPKIVNLTDVDGNDVLNKSSRSGTLIVNGTVEVNASVGVIVRDDTGAMVGYYPELDDTDEGTFKVPISITGGEGVYNITVNATDVMSNKNVSSYVTVRLDLTGPGAPVVWGVDGSGFLPDTNNPSLNVIGYISEVGGVVKTTTFEGLINWRISVANVSDHESEHLKTIDLINPALYGDNYDAGKNYVWVDDAYRIDSSITVDHFVVFSDHDLPYFEAYDVFGVTDHPIYATMASISPNLQQDVIVPVSIDIYTWKYPPGWFNASVTLFEGDNIIQLIANDSLANEGTPVLIYITLDSTQPVITPDRPVGTTSNNKTIINASLDGTGTAINESTIIMEIDGPVRCEGLRVGAGGALTYRDDYVYYAISASHPCGGADEYVSGRYNATVNVSDAAGNHNSTKWEFIVDTGSAAVREFVVSPAYEQGGIWFGKAVEWINITFEEQVNATNWTLYSDSSGIGLHKEVPTGTEGQRFDYEPTDVMEDGSYDFNITVEKDAGGFYSNPVTYWYNITIDTRAPSIVSLLLATAHSYNDSLFVRIRVTDFVSGVNETSIKLVVSNGTSSFDREINFTFWQGNIYNATINRTIFDSLGLVNYTLTYIADDNLGNRNITIQNISVIDDIDPEVVSYEPTGTIKQAVNSLNITVVEKSLLDSYKITLNGDEIAQSDITTTPTQGGYMFEATNLPAQLAGSGLAGANVVKVNVTDGSGNKLENFEWTYYVNPLLAEIRNLTLDKSDVATSEIIEVKDQGYANLTVDFKVACVEFETDVSVVTYNLTIDGINEDIELLSNTARTYCYELNGGSLVNGNYTLNLTSVDSIEYLRTFIVDTTPPTITLGNIIDLTSQEYVEINGTVSDASPVNVTVGGLEATVDENGFFNVTVQLTSEGINTFTVLARDYAGNYDIATVNITLDQTGPTFMARTIPTLTGLGTVNMIGYVNESNVNLTVHTFLGDVSEWGNPGHNSVTKEYDTQGRGVDYLGKFSFVDEYSGELNVFDFVYNDLPNGEFYIAFVNHPKEDFSNYRVERYTDWALNKRIRLVFPLLEQFPPNVEAGSKEFYVYNSTALQARYPPGWFNITLNLLGNGTNFINTNVRDALNNSVVTPNLIAPGGVVTYVYQDEVVLDQIPPNITNLQPTGVVSDNQTLISVNLNGTITNINESSIVMDISGPCDILDMVIGDNLSIDEDNVVRFDIAGVDNNRLCDGKNEYKEGDYTVTLNVSDMLGNYNNATWQFTTNTGIAGVQEFNVTPALLIDGKWYSKSIDMINVTFNSVVRVPRLVLYNNKTGVAVSMTLPTYNEGTQFNFTPATMVHGNYTFNITAEKPVGGGVYTSPITFSYPIVIDTVGPTIEVQHTLNARYNYTDIVELEIRVTDELGIMEEANVTINSIEYKMNYTGSNIFKFNITDELGLDLAIPYTITYESRDLLGNEVTLIDTQQVEYVDGVGPLIFDEYPTHLSWINNITPRIGVNVTDLTGVANVTFTLEANGKPTRQLTTQNISTFFYYDVPPLTVVEMLVNGTIADDPWNKIIVTANDTSGQESTYEWTFYVNTELAKLDDVSLFEDLALTGYSVFAYKYTNLSDDYDIACIKFKTDVVIDQFDFRVDGQDAGGIDEVVGHQNNPYCYELAFNDKLLLVEGNYTINLTLDTGLSNLIYFIIDRTKPNVTIDESVTTLTNLDRIEINGSVNDSLSPVNVTVSYGGNEWVATIDSDGTYNATVTLPSGDGTYEFVVVATDKANNKNVTSIEISRDGTGPKFIARTMPALTGSSTVNVVGYVNESNVNVTVYVYKPLLNHLTFPSEDIEGEFSNYVGRFNCNEVSTFGGRQAIFLPSPILNSLPEDLGVYFPDYSTPYFTNYPGDRITAPNPRIELEAGVTLSITAGDPSCVFDVYNLTDLAQPLSNLKYPPGWFNISVRLLDNGTNFILTTAKDRFGNVVSAAGLIDLGPLGYNIEQGISAYEDTIVLDQEVPTISNLQPAEDSVLSVNTVLVRARVEDTPIFGAGVDDSSISIGFEGPCSFVVSAPVVTYSSDHVEFDVTGGTYCNGAAAYQTGTYNVTLNVSDSLGNKVITKWNFTINNDVPADPVFMVNGMSSSADAYSGIFYINSSEAVVEIRFSDADVNITKFKFNDSKIERNVPNGYFNESANWYNYTNSTLVDGLYTLALTAAKGLSGVYGLENTYGFDLLVDLTHPWLDVVTVLYTNNREISLDVYYVEENPVSINVTGDVIGLPLNVHLGALTGYKVNLSHGNGSKNIYTTIYDLGGNSYTNLTMVVLDQIKPDVAINVSNATFIDGIYYSADLTLNVTCECNDSVTSINTSGCDTIERYYRDSSLGPWNLVAGDILSISFVDEVVVEYMCNVTDRVGNYNNDTITIKLDKSPPVVTFVAPENNYTSISTPTFIINTSEPSYCNYSINRFFLSAQVNEFTTSDNIEHTYITSDTNNPQDDLETRGGVGIWGNEVVYSNYVRCTNLVGLSTDVIEVNITGDNTPLTILSVTSVKGSFVTDDEQNTINVETSKLAKCRYSDTPATPPAYVDLDFEMNPDFAIRNTVTSTFPTGSEHKVYIDCMDLAGNTATNPSWVNFTVDTTLVLNIDDSGPTGTINDDSPTLWLKVNKEATVGCTFDLDSHTSSALLVDPNNHRYYYWYYYDVGVTLPDSPPIHAYAVSCSDGANTVTGSIDFEVDTQPPTTPAITVPTSGAYVSYSTAPVFVVSGTTDADAVKVYFYLNNTYLGDATVTSQTFTKTLDLSTFTDGSWTIKISAEDQFPSNGRSDNHTVDVIKDTVSEVPVLDLLLDDYTNESTVNISGTAEPGSTISYYLAATSLGPFAQVVTSVADASGFFNYSVPLYTDSNFIYVTAQDFLSNPVSAESNRVDIIYDNQLPLFSGNMPQGSVLDRMNVLIYAYVDDNYELDDTTVEMTINETVVTPTVQRLSPSRLLIQYTTSFSTESHQINISVRDNSGNLGNISWIFSTFIPFQCNDDEDNDGDGLEDYLTDPGCDAQWDDDETNPPCADPSLGSPPPQCWDCIDNDGAGKIDYLQDPDCDNMMDNLEATECTVLGVQQQCGVYPPTGIPQVVGIQPCVPIVAGAPDCADGCYWDTCTCIYPSPTDPMCSLLGTGGVGGVVAIDIILGNVVSDLETVTGAAVAGSSAGAVAGVDIPCTTPFAFCIDGACMGMCDMALNCVPFAGAGAITCPTDPNLCSSDCPAVYQCNDGVDNDGDERIDFGTTVGVNDPGCDNATDNNETDVLGPPSIIWLKLNGAVIEGGDYFGEVVDYINWSYESAVYSFNSLIVDGSPRNLVDLVTQANKNYSYDLSPDLTYGPHTISFDSTNIVATTVESFMFTVDDVDPTIDIDNAIDTTVSTATSLIYGTYVEDYFYRIDINGANPDLVNPGTTYFEKEVNLNVGDNIVTATIEDLAGNTGQDTITIDMKTGQPRLSVGLPDVVPTLSAPLSGTTENSSQVTIYLDGGLTPIATLTSDATTGSFSLTLTDTAHGLHGGVNEVNVTVIDDYERINSTVKYVQVDNDGPVIVSKTPDDGDSGGFNQLVIELDDVSGIEVSTISLQFDGLPVYSYTYDGGTKTITYDISGEADGNHDVEVYVEDTQFNPIDPAIASWSFTLDRQAPTITMIYPTDRFVDSLTPILEVDVVDYDYVFMPTLTDGATPVTLIPLTQNPFTYQSGSLTENVAYDFALRASKLGNSADITEEIIADVTDPVIVIDGGAIPSVTNANSIDISGTFTELNLKNITVNGVEVSNLDIGAGAPSGPRTFVARGVSLTSVPLTGTVTVVATIEDMAGRISTDSASVTIDRVPPSSLSITSPIDTQAFGNPTTSIVGSTEAGVTLFINGVDYGIIGGSSDINVPYTLLNSGNNGINVKVVDEAGNYLEEDLTVYYDNIPPEIIISDPSGVQNDNTNVRVIATATDYSNIVEMVLAANGTTASFVPDVPIGATSGLLDKSLHFYEDGMHFVNVSATDIFGNTNYSIKEFMIDTQIPTRPQFNLDGKVVNISNPILNFTYIETVDVTSVNVTTISNTTNDDLTFTFETPDLDDGNHSLKIEAYKLIGSGSVGEEEFSFVIDTTTPLITISPEVVSHTTTTQNIEIKGSCGDELAPNAELAIEIYEGGTLAGWDICNASGGYSALIHLGSGDGDKLINVTIRDWVGNFNYTTKVITLDTGFPNVTITNITNNGDILFGRVPYITNDEKITVRGNYSDDNFDTLTVLMNNVVETLSDLYVDTLNKEFEFNITRTGNDEVLYEVVVIINDTFGLRGNDSFDITYDFMGPVIIDFYPENNVTDTRVPTINITTHEYAVNCTINYTADSGFELTQNFTTLDNKNFSVSFVTNLRDVATPQDVFITCNDSLSNVMVTRIPLVVDQVDPSIIDFDLVYAQKSIWQSDANYKKYLIKDLDTKMAPIDPSFNAASVALSVTGSEEVRCRYYVDRIGTFGGYGYSLAAMNSDAPEVLQNNSEYRFNISCEDKAGRLSDVKTIDVVVNSSFPVFAPVITLLYPEIWNGANFTIRNPKFNGTIISMTPGVNIEVSELRINGTVFALVLGVGGNFTQVVSPALPEDDNYTFTIWANNTDGDISSSTGWISVDTTGPGACVKIGDEVYCDTGVGAGPAVDLDHDGDGLPDVFEYRYFDCITCANSGNDDDSDLLINSQEYYYGTNPRLADTDGDGYTDKQEIDGGTDPNDDASHP